MSYTALYRKWRPDNFSDVKGQDHIVTTLKNQIETDRVGHAYLFCGTRGTGKTSVAKILARAINCEHPVDGSPCGECAVCKAISDGSSLNVIEIDAASNNGVDNIRQIREEVTYRPTEGKYKVYIIDEVHMLSIGAFNALLKTLEEPPSYVVFILATTESHKIPVTITSRCQRYDFKRISVETIEDRLKTVVDAEGAKVEDRALNYIAKMADGAFRDALSLLDQCMTFYSEGVLRYEDVLEVLGAVDTEVFSMMLRLVINRDVTGIIKAIDEIILQGREIGQFVTDFTWYVRNLLLLKTSPESEKMLDMSAENLRHIKEEAVMVEEIAIMRYLRILAELSQSLKYATQKRVLVEVAFIKLTRPEMESDMDSLVARLSKLEELIKDKEDLIALSAIRPEIQVGQAAPPKNTEAIVKPQLKALPAELEQIIVNWRAIVGQAPPMYENFLKLVRLSVEGETLVFATDDSFVADFWNSERHILDIKNVIENTIGKAVEISVKLFSDEGVMQDSCLDIDEYVKMKIVTEE